MTLSCPYDVQEPHKHAGSVVASFGDGDLGIKAGFVTPAAEQEIDCGLMAQLLKNFRAGSVMCLNSKGFVIGLTRVQIPVLPLPTLGQVLYLARPQFLHL